MIFNVQNDIAFFIFVLESKFKDTFNSHSQFFLMELDAVAELVEHRLPTMEKVKCSNCGRGMVTSGSG